MTSKSINRTLLTTLIGALGGFLGFLLSELFHNNEASRGFVQAMLSTAWWTALFILPLTLALTVAENLLGLRSRWWRGLALVVLPSLLIGALSGGIAQFFYGLGINLDIPQRLIRAVGWAIMGAGVGLLLGLADRSAAKALRGALGGAVGGFLGGLLFDSFTALRFGAGDTGTVARLVGLTILGAAIGFMLRLTQEFFKTAWLLGTTTGKYEGKQYILAKPVVTVGRSDANDISFYHDEQVPLKAGALRMTGKNWRWQGDAVLVNGHPTGDAELHSGDRLTFGTTELIFAQKGTTVSGRVPVPPLALQAKGQAVPFPADFQTVTLGTQGQVKVKGQGISAQHAVITAQPDGTLYLQAKVPLELNDQPLSAGSTAPLRPGDLLKLGDTEFALIKSDLVPVKS